MSVKSDSGDNQILRPRLCHLRKWSYFQGYGFNLHAEKTRNGQFIGKVDANSPAEAAGLKEKDRIIEVNYVNISNENHQQVVKRIRMGLELDGKSFENEVVLLVVDEETDNYYKKLNQVIKSDMDDVLYRETPPEDSNTNNANTSNNSTTQAKSNSPAPVRVELSSSTNDVSPKASQYEAVDSNNNHQANSSLTNSQSNTRASSNASTPASNAKFSNHYENNKVSPPATPKSNHSSNNTKTAAPVVATPTPTPSVITNNSNHSNTNNNPADDIFIKINFKNANKISSSERIPPAKPPRLSITEIERFNPDKIDSISNYSGNNGRNDRYMSSSSLVDEEFHAKGINAVREMLDSTNHLNSRKDKEHHHHHHLPHFDFSHLNPLKLSHKRSKELKTSNNNIYNENNNNNNEVYQNQSYGFLTDYRSENNNNNNNNFYNEATSIKSTKKFNSSEPITSAILGGRNTASTVSHDNYNNNSYSSSTVRSSYNEEQTQRNYNQNEKKLNEFFKMSATEFKNLLKNRQKADPRTEPVDMKQKYQLFQNM